MISIQQVQCPVLLSVWLRFEMVCDDPSNMMPPLLCHHCLGGGRDRKVWKYCRDSFLGCGDDEVRVSHIYEEKGGEVWQ